MKPTQATEVSYYEDDKGNQPVDEWIEELDRSVAMKILGRLARMKNGNFGDTKNVGDGVMESRIHLGPGYRVYFGLDDNGAVVILLCGGDKSTQDSDIVKAKDYWKDYKERK